MTEAHVDARRGSKNSQVKQADRGSPSYDEIVDETHAKFCAALVALFDRHKATHAPGATLEII